MAVASTRLTGQLDKFQPVIAQLTFPQNDIFYPLYSSKLVSLGVAQEIVISFLIHCCCTVGLCDEHVEPVKLQPGFEIM